MSDVDHSARLDFDAVSKLEQLFAAEMPGRWIALNSDPACNNLIIATDVLGAMWLYYAATPTGFAWSTDFGSLARSLPRLTVNKQTLGVELALGYTPDGRTLFDEIQLCPPGAILEFSVSGVTVRSAGAQRYGDRLAGQSRQRKYDELDHHFSRITGEMLAPVADRLVLSLSAGYDSRFVLAYLQRAGLRTPLCTFGHPDSDEVHGARNVAAQVNMDTSVFAVPEADWAQWRRCIQALGNTGMTQWSGWAESWIAFLARRGQHVAIGYLGDALSGKHLGAGSPDKDWLRFWIEWSTDGGWLGHACLRPSMRGEIRAVVEKRLAGCLAGQSFAFPHQQALHLDLIGRQRRWVASQPTLLARRTAPVLFFYDPQLMSFWCNLAEADQIDQRLYLGFARERFPHLFEQPSSAHKTFLNRVTRRLLGTGVPKRPSVVNHENIIGPNVELIVDLAAKVKPLVDDVIDVDALCVAARSDREARRMPSDLIMQAVNCFHLLEMAV